MLLGIAFVFGAAVLFSGCLGSGDSDQDGLEDGVERGGWYVNIYYVNGSEKEIHVTSDPNKYDTDGDGLSDYEEFVNVGILNPRNPDTDGDGLSDYEELKVYGTQPNKQDSEIWPDGLMDGIEIRGWNITINGETKKVYSNPDRYDTDGDGLSDHEEWLNGTDPSSEDSDSDDVTDFGDVDPTENVKMLFRITRFTLSASYGKDAKPYIYIKTEGGGPVRSDFIGIVHSGETVNLDNFVEIVDVSDYKNLYPLNVEISVFDNTSHESIHQYIPLYNEYIDVTVDKALVIYGKDTTYSFNFEITDLEREISISGDDCSVTFIVSRE